MHEACAQMAGWHALGHDELHVSVNVSARQFKLQDVPALVRGVLEDTGLPPEALELELTESVGIDPDGSVGAALLELQELGVRCSIDDFGTGYSSISYLHEYPVDTIKLDRSFVQDIGAGQDAPIVRAVIAMAHNLGLRVVAEGVETKAQLKFLEKHHCDEVQGFLFSRPLPALGVPAFLNARAAMTPAGRRRVPTMAVAALATTAVMDEEALGRLLWEESELNAGEDLHAVRRGRGRGREGPPRPDDLLDGRDPARAGDARPRCRRRPAPDHPEPRQRRRRCCRRQPGRTGAGREPHACRTPRRAHEHAQSPSCQEQAGAGDRRRPPPRRRSDVGPSFRGWCAKPSTRPRRAGSREAGQEARQEASQEAGGPAAGPTTPPAVTTPKPKGNKSVAPGRVKKSTRPLRQ